MAKKKTFCRLRYDKPTDRMCLEITSDDGETWGLDTSVQFVRSEHDSANDEPEYLHGDIIAALKKAVNCGFEFTV